MKTFGNLISGKAYPDVKPCIFSCRARVTSIVSILLIGVSLILTACGQAIAEVTKTYTPAATATATDTPEPTATHTQTERPTPTATMEPIATSTRRPTPTATPTATATSEFGLCPIDSQEISSVLFTIDEYGYNYDLLASHGTPIRAPGYCTIINLFIDRNGTNGIQMRCNSYPLNIPDRISFGHIDLSYENYATLHQYGIPIETFFGADGFPLIGVENVVPRNNTRYHAGDIIAFVGNTGNHAMPYHLHIDVFDITNDQFIKLNPLNYFQCP